MDDLQPARGAPETLARRLSDFVSPHAPQMLARWRGSPETLVERYAALAFGGHADAVPRSYLEYARALGTDDGGLFASFNIVASLESVVKLYEDCIRAEPESLNPELPLVATYRVGDQISFDRHDGSAREPRVVETSDGELVEELSTDWECLVMQAAMLHVEARRLPMSRWESAATESVTRSDADAAIADFGARHGMIHAWPSGGQRAILVAPGQSLFATTRAAGGVMLHTFSTGPEFFRTVERELSVALHTSAGGALRLQGDLLVDAR